MRRFLQQPLGCLTILMLAVIVWVAIQFVFLPSAERHVQRHGHTLKDYTDRLFRGR
ncbi:MAG TPA: hypothetical protein PLD51_07115 [Pontiellaceae bacterium]|nr:hypothetical protein [Pontiellaceae bacterium]